MSLHVRSHEAIAKDGLPSPPTSDIEKTPYEVDPNDAVPTRVVHHVVADKLARKLSARQVQMIAIGGTIGTGLFLGTGKSLATGGPASMLIAYAIVGAIVFITMLSLGEMSSFVPIAGSFCTFAGRFVDDAFGFALTWNYWFNDAVSMASDLVALQLILQYWTSNFPGWGLSLIFWVLLILANIVTVKIYGEVHYAHLLKVITIIIFIILGIAVNAGGNTDHNYIGGHNWFIGDAPFVGGIGGFASVFVTAAFAYGGTESIAITAGETKDPARTMPKVVRNVFWRILLFYILSVLILGLNVPYTTSGLNSKDTRTSPFTIVFQMAGSKAAGSFINAVIMTSVLSAGNHALFAGTRLLYTLAIDRHAPPFFSALNRNQVPWIAVLATSAISILCFGASFIGAGQLWTWLQNIVGVSNQLSWIAIGIASLRFRAAIRAQGKEHLLPFKNWTYPWGPWCSVVLNIFLVLVQGWSSFSPSFSAVTFVSLYVELPIMLLMYLGWKLLKRTKIVGLKEMDLETDTYPADELDPAVEAAKSPWKERVTEGLLARLQIIDMEKGHETENVTGSSPLASNDMEKGSIIPVEDMRSPDKVLEHAYDADEAMKAMEGHEGEVLQLDEATNKRLLRKIDLNLMPLLCVIYGLNYLDKTTLSYASVMGIQKDIHLVGDDYQWLGSMFYFGYLAWEYPTNRLLQRLPLAKYSSFCIIMWGLVLCCMAATKNYSGAIAVRFFLGVFEAAVTPGFALFTSQWYTKKEQGTRTGIWFSFNGWAQIFGGLVAYGIAKGTRLQGSSIEPWKIVFLVTGLLTASIGCIFLFIMPDNQLNARWLSKDDRRLAIERVRVNQQGIGNKHFKLYQLKEALLDPMTWAFTFYALVADIPNGGISNFFSQLIVSFGYSQEQSLLYGTPGGAVEVVSLIVCGYLGDRYGHRILFSCSGLVIAIIGMILIVAAPLSSPSVRLAGYYLTQASPTPFVALLSLISTNVAGYTKKTTVAALYLIAYCAGNIIGPQTFRPKDAPRYTPAEVTIIVCWGACLIDLLFIYVYYINQNKKKAAHRAQPSYRKLGNQEWLDLTDKENPEFVFTL